MIRLRFDDVEDFLAELDRYGAVNFEGPCVRFKLSRRFTERGRLEDWSVVTCVVGERLVLLECAGDVRPRVEDYAARNGLGVRGGVYEVG